MRYKILVLFLIFNLVSLGKSITISAAASLKDYLEKNIKLYRESHDIDINVNLGSSGTLKKQLEQGAPIDIIFLADKSYVLDLKENGYINSVHDVLKNKLVLIKSNLPQSKSISLAIGNPAFVPAGKYAQELLKNTQLDFSYSTTIYGRDVRNVLNYVELGEVDYGIVYLSDTQNLKNSQIVKIFNEDLYSPIIYSLGVSVDSSMKKESLEFINFLKGRSWLD